MTGNHLMLLLFRSVLSVCCGSRCRRRLQQSSLIGNSVNVRLYSLSFLVGRIRIYPIPAHNEGVASERSSKFYYVCILLDPVVDIYQWWSAIWLGALHKCGYVYPAVIWLHLKLEVRPIGASYGAGLIATLWVCVKHIFSRKQHTSANWPCLNKALLSSLTELCNLCKCLCHS